MSNIHQKPPHNRFRSNGFQYRGKDKRGVSRWQGDNWNKVLRWVGIIFVCYAAAAGVAVAAMVLYTLITGLWPPVFNGLVFGALAHTASFGGTGVWMLRMRRHIATLSTPDELCARFDVSAAALEQAASARGIKPRMSINDVDYYNPADFALEAFTLLRGASEPATTADVLLRAAGNSQDEIHAEQLLRPSLTDQVQEDAVPSAYTPTTQYQTNAPVQTIQTGLK